MVCREKQLCLLKRRAERGENSEKQAAAKIDAFAAAGKREFDALAFLIFGTPDLNFQVIGSFSPFGKESAWEWLTVRKGQ